MSANLSKNAQIELRRKGVQAAKRFGARMAYRVSCWLEKLPLQREGCSPSITFTLLFPMSSSPT